jgi:predicted alpha/beta hydrolase
MGTEDLSIVSDDGARHTLRLFQPAAAAGRPPVVLCLPAMGVAAEYYTPFARMLAYGGRMASALLDLRGQGSSSERARKGADFGYREILELDLPAALAALRERFPTRSLYIAGHSLGGQLGLFFAARRQADVDGLVLIAAGTAQCQAWPAGRARLAARVVTFSIRSAAALLPWYPGHVLGFGGEQPRRLMRDWGRVTREGLYRPEGTRFDYERAARFLRTRVLSIGVREDPVAPEPARDALLARLPLAEVTRTDVNGVALHRPWKRHFSWARDPQEIAGAIAGWLNPM